MLVGTCCIPSVWLASWLISSLKSWLTGNLTSSVTGRIADWAVVLAGTCWVPSAWRRSCRNGSRSPTGWRPRWTRPPTPGGSRSSASRCELLLLSSILSNVPLYGRIYLTHAGQRVGRSSVRWVRVSTGKGTDVNISWLWHSVKL